MSATRTQARDGHRDCLGLASLSAAEPAQMNGGPGKNEPRPRMAVGWLCDNIAETQADRESVVRYPAYRVR